MFQTHRQLLSLCCWLILACFSSEALQNTSYSIFARENGPVEMKWPLFIGENADRSVLNVMIKKRNARLCQWVKLPVNEHREDIHCDPGLNLTIAPKHVCVPGPTNITATFSFKNKGLADDGTYECRFVIDEKWHEMQVYPRHLVTTAEPTVTLSATYSNTCIADIICHVRGGRPKPVETILMKNGTDISRSRLKCEDDADKTDGAEVSYCSSVHSVENSGGQYKCRVQHAEYVVDSAEVDIPYRTQENETCAACPGMNDHVCAANTLVYVIITLTSIIFALIVFVVVLVYLHILEWRPRKHMKIHGSGSGESHLPYGLDFGNGQETEIPDTVHV